MECVILFRNPWNGVIGYISDVDPFGESIDDQIAVFRNYDEASEFASTHALLKIAVHQIIELEI